MLNNKSFSFFQKIVDVSVCLAAWFISYIIRFKYLPNAETGLDKFFLQVSPFMAIITLYFFYKNELYSSQRFKSGLNEVLKIFKANSFAVLTLIISFYFLADARVSRFFVVLYFFVSCFMLTLTRITARNLLRNLRKKGKNLRYVLLVGNGRLLHNYIETVRIFKDSGIKIGGWIDSSNNTQFLDIKRLDMTIEEAKEKFDLAGIILSYAGEETYKIEKILKDHHNDVCPIHVLPDLTYSFVGHEIEDFGGIPLITINQPGIPETELFFKRLFDFISSFIGLIIISPILITISLLIKLTSKGPIFYAQERVGLDGKNFNMWKFRTMSVPKTNEDKDTWSSKNNPRVTKIGSILRKTSLDEFPQLWNVLKGEMSIVGPRPERPYFVNKFKAEIPQYMLRHKISAGITGWAQINGWRGDTSIKKRIECDIYYIKNWSFWFDIKIIFLTFWKGFINKNAY